jgi:hypothetical protein
MPNAKEAHSMTSIEQLFDRIEIARQHGADELAAIVLRRFIRSRSHLPRPRPEIEAFRRKRESFTQLRDRHLLMVEEYGCRPDYDRNELGRYFLANWNRLFGPLRKSKALEVSSDGLRKEMMASRLLARPRGGPFLLPQALPRGCCWRGTGAVKPTEYIVR